MELQTERLILREFTANDWPAVLDYQREPLYLRYNLWIERTPEDVQQFVQLFLDQQAQQPRTRFQLAVVLRATGELIGNCGIRLKAIDASEAEIGYELAPRFWGCGYATEAAREIVGWGFAEFKLHRIVAHCVAENLGSARVLAKLGMQQEGRLRESEYFKDRWWDALLFAILDHEWQARQQPGGSAQ